MKDARETHRITEAILAEVAGNEIHRAADAGSSWELAICTSFGCSCWKWAVLLSALIIAVPSRNHIITKSTGDASRTLKNGQVKQILSKQILVAAVTQHRTLQLFDMYSYSLLPEKQKLCLSGFDVFRS